MASVWEAHDELLDRRVAVKVLAAAPGRGRARAPALRARGADRRRALLASERRHDLRRRRARGQVVHRDGAASRGGTRRRPAARRTRRSRTAWRCAGSARPPRRSTPRTRPGSCTATSSPRTCCIDSQRTAPAGGLRHRAARPRGPDHPDRPGARHRGLPVSRAGDGRAVDRRLGPLRAGGRGVRAADRRAGRSARELRRPGARARRRRPAAAPRARRRRPARRRPVLARGMAKEPDERWDSAGALRATRSTTRSRRRRAPRASRAPPRPDEDATRVMARADGAAAAAAARRAAAAAAAPAVAAPRRRRRAAPRLRRRRRWSRWPRCCSSPPARSRS